MFALIPNGGIKFRIKKYQVLKYIKIYLNSKLILVLNLKTK